MIEEDFDDEEFDDEEALTVGAMKYIIELLIDNANDAKSDAAQNKGDAYFEGKKMAYYEVLDTIKNQLLGHCQDPAKYGLGMNLDKEYL